MALNIKPTTLAAAGALAALIVAERVWPLRRQVRPALPRNLRNAVLGASCAVVIAAVEDPLARKVAVANERRGVGFARKLPSRMRFVGALAAMDYGFYLWHIATHKWPALWRFHRVHHIDPDMDASTALRFHTVDMLVSLPWRLVQTRLSGATPAQYGAWRSFFTASVLFHHSNLRLPERFERALSLVLTTPRMHGIHHSQVVEEMDSNFTSGISLWDRLHGTFRSRPGQEAITIGVDDPRAEADLALPESLAAPFLSQPDTRGPATR